MNAQNNTLGLNSETVKAILTIADNLRLNFNTIGATAHQMPRNPYPMHKLVMNVLPTSKSKALSGVEIRQALKAAGYHFSTYGNKGAVYVSQVLHRLVKSGAVCRIGSGKGSRYWFAF